MARKPEQTKSCGFGRELGRTALADVGMAGMLQEAVYADGAARLEAAQAKAREAGAEAKRLRQQIGELLELRDLFRDAARAMNPPARWVVPPKEKGKPTVTVVPLFSDLQAGENTNPKHVDGWGRFNYAILSARRREYQRRFLRWVGVQRGGYTISDCTVVALGDMISGDLHEDLVRTNEFPPPMQVVAAAREVAGFVSAMSGSFRRVTLEWIGASNHGRITRKPSMKAAALMNWDYAVCEMAAALLAKHGNVTIRHHIGRSEVLNIEGWKFLASHGDTVRAWMGIPWYGIERELSREARRHLVRMREQVRREEPVEGGFDYGLGAHWHTPFIGPSFSFIVNGSFTGSTDLDDAVGRHAGPQQVSFLVSPTHGMFSPVAWKLETEAEAALVGVDGQELLYAERTACK